MRIFSSVSAKPLTSLSMAQTPFRRPSVLRLSPVLNMFCAGDSETRRVAAELCQAARVAGEASLLVG